MQFTLVTLLTSATAALAAPGSSPAGGASLNLRDGNPDYGVPNARCIGGSGDGEDVIQCPNQADYDTLCSRNDMREELGLSDLMCVTDSGGAWVGSGDDKVWWGQCYCVNGNFCCENSGSGSTVPGGQWAGDYFKMQGCECVTGE